MANQLDRLLAAYCSPTLAGIKPASLVSCDRGIFPYLPQQLAEYRSAFASRGIRFLIICICRERFLLLVYHRKLLSQRLSDPCAQQVLQAFGYPVGQPMPLLLGQLIRRIAQTDSFPHEIGLFLGYPTEDVVGFIRHKGKNCKFSGLWKVYGDPMAASQLFDRITRVCRAVTRRIEQGETLLQVFAAA